MPRRFAVLFAFLILVVAVLTVALWVLLQERRTGRRPGPPIPTPAELPTPPEPELVLQPARFDDLPGWPGDAPEAAVPALRASCRVFARRPAEAPVGPDGLGGTVADWRPLCDEIRGLAKAGASGILRGVLEARLRPWAVTDRGVEHEGLFTGYFEPELRGSRRRHGPFQTPLYREPEDLVEVDLGAFRESLDGRRIAGRVVGGRLEPYHDRREIARGALAGRGLELVWVDDPVDAFFLQIQGSGRVVLDDGTVLRVGYAGQNGHPYTAIGRELVARGALELEEVSLQSIRRWLDAHPEEASAVMAENASYVFFRTLDRVAAGRGPLGSLGVPLTPGRSLAVDDRFLPLGVPLWLAGSMPRVPGEIAEAPGGSDSAAPPAGPAESEARPLRRLLVAQDTGGAIRGPVRGDVFWGAGDRAEAIAGRMKHPGRIWLLLPRSVEPAGAVGPVPASDETPAAR